MLLRRGALPQQQQTTNNRTFNEQENGHGDNGDDFSKSEDPVDALFGGDEGDEWSYEGCKC